VTIPFPDGKGKIHRKPSVIPEGSGCVKSPYISQMWGVFFYTAVVISLEEFKFNFNFTVAIPPFAGATHGLKVKANLSQINRVSIKLFSLPSLVKKNFGWTDWTGPKVFPATKKFSRKMTTTITIPS
jgi:hypothetical protein